ECVPNEPIVFEFMKGASGSTPYDWVSTSLPPLALMSQRLLDGLSGFSGWATYPVEVYGKHKERIEGYHGFSITGRCGPIDRVMGRKLWRDRPADGPFKHNRRFYYFDPSAWDGRDIFVPDGPGSIMILEPVMRALKRARITNIEMWHLPSF
ncbi:MAG: hypothetical protein KKB50_21665, partial [Planctomycetes bacterium]|nr:hypothetical protein [Planctomycetota bacterium]